MEAAALLLLGAGAGAGDGGGKGGGSGGNNQGGTNWERVVPG